MRDDETTVAELRHSVGKFVEERDWAQFHNAKDLSASLCIEAAELLEEFQWLSPEEVRAASLNAPARARMADELADVLIYCLSLANALDMDLSTIVRGKLVANARKYPADQFRGRFRLEG